MTTNLRGVSVGAGYFSQFHHDAWRRIPGVELTATCDVDLQKASEIAKRHGVPRVYADVEAMLDAETPDFIDIVTPPETHAAITTLAAERGVAVICQKALAPTYQEARAIIAAAEAANLRFMVHDNFRFQPWHREIRRLIDTGEIGELQSIASTTRLGDGWSSDAYLARQPYFRDMPRFLIFETGVHFIDVFRYLGGEIARVFARLRRLHHAIAGEDRAIMLCELESGASAFWDADRYHETLVEDARYTFGAFLIEGSSGAIRLDESGAVLIHRLGKKPVEHAYQHRRVGFAGDCVHATLTHFVERLIDGRPFETSGSDYLRTLAVQEAVYRSAASGALEDVRYA
jgi:predicted dehydrogenase